LDDVGLEPANSSDDLVRSAQDLEVLLTHVEPLEGEPVVEEEEIVPSHAELFGDDFDDEEVVIDRHNTLDVSALGERSQVVTPLGQAFAREVAILEMPRPALRIVDVPDEAADRPAPLHVTVAAIEDEDVEYAPSLADNELDDCHLEDSEFDPVYPEEEAAVVVEPRTAAPKQDGRAPATQPKVVAIDPAQSSTPKPHGAAAPLGRFRNLFATLRNKKN
jgi:hypothetical protein